MMLQAVGLFLGVYACFSDVLAQPISVRSVCSYMSQESTQDAYCCRITNSNVNDNYFVLTAKLAPNAKSLTIYGWQKKFALIVEEAVDKIINLIGPVNCQNIIMISRRSSISQCGADQTKQTSSEQQTTSSGTSQRTSSQQPTPSQWTSSETSQQTTSGTSQQTSSGTSQQTSSQQTSSGTSQQTSSQQTSSGTSQQTSSGTSSQQPTPSQQTSRQTSLGTSQQPTPLPTWATQNRPSPITYWDVMIIAITALAGVALLLLGCFLYCACKKSSRFTRCLRKARSSRKLQIHERRLPVPVSIETAFSIDEDKL